MNTYGIDALVRIVSHFGFIYMTFWALQALRLDELFKKGYYRQIRMLLVLSAIGIGFLTSTFFLELLTLFRNLIKGLPFIS